VESGFTWDLIFYGSNVGGSAAVEMMRWDASEQNINIAGHKITNLATGTNPSDAARFDQISAYLPLAGGVMDALATIDMSGGSIEDVHHIEDLYKIYARDTGGDLDILYVYSDSGTKMAAAITIQSDTTVSASLFGNLSMNSKKITGLAAATVNGDAVRYNEFHAHDIATTGVHGAGANTIEHTGHKGAASGYCGLDVDGYIPSVGILAPLTKGNLMVGSATIVTALGVGTNTHVLTLDSSEALGMKWSAAGAGLWKVDGSESQLITADDIDMQAHGFIGISSLKSNHYTGMIIYDSNGAMKAYLGTTDYALKANNHIDMAGYDIIRVDEMQGATNQAIHIKPMGTGILYLG
jgi:hypothetical protein